MSRIFALVLALWMVVMAAPGSALVLKPGNSAVREITLPLPAEATVQLVQEALQVWPRGELVKTRYEDRDPAGPHWIVKGISRTNFFKFVDDLEIDIRRDPAHPEQSLVTLTSVGRQGEYDFGGNGRNLQELLATLNTLQQRS